jgi:purine-binding chemotaxis protein CheW
MHEGRVPQSGEPGWKSEHPQHVMSASAGPAEFISFAIGDEQYGVDIMAVREIKEWPNVTPLPEQPDFLRGVINLRGAMVPIVDLRCRFGEGLTEATPTHIVIIVQIGERQVGLLADRVLDIVSYEAGGIQPVPRIAQARQADFLLGLITIEGGMIALIDLPSLLINCEIEPQSSEIEHLEKMSAQ